MSVATKNKNFLSALQNGESRDQQMRQAVASRFDKVEAALEGRVSLLEPPEPQKATEEGGGFYVETLVKEGRAHRRFARIAIALIDDNPLNSRKFYDEEKVKARAASIAADGQMVPVLVAPSQTQKGRYTLVDGHYRKRAHLHLSKPEMDCMVLEGLAPLEFYKLARTLNSEREAETFLDVAFSYRQLLDEGYAKTEEDLAFIVGESKTKINKMLAASKLPQSIIDAMAANPDRFGYNIGYELSQYCRVTGEDQTLDLAKRIIREELSFLKVEAIRKKAQEGTKAKRHTSRQYKLMRNGIELGTLKEWDTGRITLDLTESDPARREALLASVKAQLGLDDEGQ